MEENKFAYGWWITDESRLKYGLREGYHEAALRLINSSKKEESMKTRDTLIFPILFLHTHSLEILLKEIIEKINLRNHKLNIHNLAKLYKEILLPNLNIFLELNEIKNRNFEKELSWLSNEIESIQNGSILNRYLSQYDKNLEKDVTVYEKGIIVDYKLLYERIERSYDILDGLLSWIEEIIDNINNN